jgi:uncharacterized FAD-dependent dehydrogenase
VLLRINNIKLGLDQEENELPAAVARKLGIPAEHIGGLKIVRQSVDARHDQVNLVYALELKVADGFVTRRLLHSPDISAAPQRPRIDPACGESPLESSPVIVGTGPAGLFCALILAQHGFAPVLLERGKPVDQRVKDVEAFWRGGSLDPESNVQFGEGGAGTFSDGKLTTRIGDARVDYVLETMARLGAPPEITFLHKPHVGTDRLRAVVKAMRREIIKLGGRIYFGARVTDLVIEQGAIKSLEINGDFILPCSLAVLAIGNSARDFFPVLLRRGISLKPKGFAVGVRIEHPQALIDKIQYGKYAGHPRLGPADYRLTYQDEESGRAVYTFCMCPGGKVIASASDSGQVVTNGMSLYARDSGWANSALVVTVSASSLGEQPLAGVLWQEELEARAFAAGGCDYSAPVQRVSDFLAGRSSEECGATYRPGVKPSNLWQVLPSEICQVLARSLLAFDRKMPGFAGPEAVLVGVETRTSCPVRIERDSDRVSVSCGALYPCGEGAGYAGGIVSSAVDGMKTAESIIETYRKPKKGVNIDRAEVTDASLL